MKAKIKGGGKWKIEHTAIPKSFALNSQGYAFGINSTSASNFTPLVISGCH